MKSGYLIKWKYVGVEKYKFQSSKVLKDHNNGISKTMLLILFMINE